MSLRIVPEMSGLRAGMIILVTGDQQINREAKNVQATNLSSTESWLPSSRNVQVCQLPGDSEQESEPEWRTSWRTGAGQLRWNQRLSPAFLKPCIGLNEDAVGTKWKQVLP